LELHLQNVEREGGQNDPPVEDAVGQKPALGPQQGGGGREQDDPGGRQYDAAHGPGPDQQGKDPVGLFPIPFAKGHGDQGAAAGAQHEPGAAQDDEHRHDEIDCRKGGLTREIGHEEPVHHAID
jgi:hypothetical protein